MVDRVCALPGIGQPRAASEASLPNSHYDALVSRDVAIPVRILVREQINRSIVVREAQSGFMWRAAGIACADENQLARFDEQVLVRS